jgi:hypothetical protein
MPENTKKHEDQNDDASQSLEQAAAEADVQGHSDEDSEADQDLVITATGGYCSG